MVIGMCLNFLQVVLVIFRFLFLSFGCFFRKVLEQCFMNGYFSVYQVRLRKGIQISFFLRKNLKYGVCWLNIWINVGMLIQDWWLFIIRYEVFWCRLLVLCMFQIVGVQVVKIYLLIFVQVLVIYIMFLEQRFFRCWLGSISLSSVISIIGLIRISVLRSSRRLLVRLVNSFCMVGFFVLGVG